MPASRFLVQVDHAYIEDQMPFQAWRSPDGRAHLVTWNEGRGGYWFWYPEPVEYTSLDNLHQRDTRQDTYFSHPHRHALPLVATLEVIL